MGRRGFLVIALAAGLCALPLAPSRAAEAPSQALYDIAPPIAHQLKADDGVDLFAETWLPAAKGGNVPPAKVPVVLSISPYLAKGAVEDNWLKDLVVKRGYAYSNLHVRGTGESGGCIDLFGSREVKDSAQFIEFVGKAAWSDGNVGAFGVSYPGGTILSVAGRGEKKKVKYLKAVVSGAPYHSAHEAQWTFDGVPSFLVPTTFPLSYFAQSMGFDFSSYTPTPRTPERPGCQPQHMAAAVDWSGNHTPWHAERDNRAWTKHIKAATFIFHGHRDLVPFGGSPPSIERGLFDELSQRTPKHGIFGEFGHWKPIKENPGFEAKVVAWFDRYLKGVDAGVDQWPVVEVQGTDGMWRSEADWPTVGGPVGAIPLKRGGTATQYLEGSYETTSGFAPGTAAVFETEAMKERLELTGQPVLDLWLTLVTPDSHVAARIEVVDAAGKVVDYTYGLRSAQHLDPFKDGRFVQATAKVAPIGVPVNVPVRFQPTDLVVQPGQRLRVVVSGSVIVNPGLSQFGIPEPVFYGPSQPSYVAQPVTIHHDCTHPSVLRFEMPSATSQVLAGATPAVSPATDSDGGGVAAGPLC